MTVELIAEESDTDGPAAALAPMVEVWFRILVAHVPDDRARCRACTSAGTGERNTPWPCVVRGVAALARRRHAALVGPPRGRTGVRRVLHGAHGSCRMTPREREFLQLAANGNGDVEIAAQLGVAERTVRFTIRRLARKLGVGDRSELLVLALRSGVVV